MDFKWRYNWHKLDPPQEGKINTLEELVPVSIRIGDYRICVIKMEGEIYGVNNICPHAGAALHAGFVNKKGVITCPLHGYKFDVRNGKSADGHNYNLWTARFEQREDGWYAGIKKF